VAEFSFPNQQRPSESAAAGLQPWLHRLLITLWLLAPLLCGFFNLEHQSLIAHDEGLYASRARAMLIQQDWIHPWSAPHHKTPGAYWILAVMFQLFGTTEITARLPSVLASLACALLSYELAKTLCNSQVALWSILTLSTSFLWVQYSRLATPDIVFIALLLSGLLCLLKAEKSEQYGSSLRFLAGVSWSLAFLVRSFLVMLPIAALMPYLLLENRRHRHLSSPWFYAGIGLGLLPTLLWLWACWQRYGSAIFQGLLGFPVLKATEQKQQGSGFLFYLISLTVNSLPWSLFSLIGLGLVFKRWTNPRQLWLLGIYPVMIYGLISLASNHFHHYALVLYPWLAVLAGIAMTWMGRSTSRWARRSVITLALLLGLLGAILLVLSSLLYSPALRQAVSAQDLLPYLPTAFTLGLVWLVNTVLWLATGQRVRWLMGLLLANWLTLIVVGASGLLGNYNPQLKAFLLHPPIQTVLTQHPVTFTPLDGKLDTLFHFYTPHYGLELDRLGELAATWVQDLPPSGYAWVWEDNLGNITVPYSILDNFNQVFLIQLGTDQPPPLTRRDSATVN
jgi:4-amino-4-deoxy-L-arabinose transferase-like glycosyltransferase